MTIKRNILKHALASLGVLSLAACSGGDEYGTQDVGTGGSSTSSRVLAARVVDGYLAGATVYVDQNENGKLDSFEPRALTDADGYFSYNHRTNTDYCASDAPAAHAKHCLRASIASDADVLIRASGGYDTITKLPFNGVLSLRSNALDPEDLRLVTPLTSMLANTTDPEKTLAALIGAGLPSDGSLIQDPYATSALEAAVFGQIIAVLAHLQSEAAIAGGVTQSDRDAFKAQAASEAFHVMAIHAVESTSPGSFFQKAASVEALTETLRHVRYRVEHGGEQVPDSYELPNLTTALPYLEVSAKLAQLGEALVAAVQSGNITEQDIAAVQRLVAVIAERALSDPHDPEINDAFAWASNQLAQGNGLGSDLARLGDADVDPSVLIARDFDFDPTSNSISASAKIPAEAAFAFAALANTSFGVSVSEGDRQGAALVYISGDNGVRTGDLDVCVRYRDNSGDFDTGTVSDPNGAMLVSGHWNLLDDHTLVLNIDVVGGVRSLLLKSVGVRGLDREYRFDFGRELLKWSGSTPAAFAVGNLPKSDAECRSALVERFGSM